MVDHFRSPRWPSNEKERVALRRAISNVSPAGFGLPGWPLQRYAGLSMAPSKNFVVSDSVYYGV